MKTQISAVSTLSPVTANWFGRPHCAMPNCARKTGGSRSASPTTSSYPRSASRRTARCSDRQPVAPGQVMQVFQVVDDHIEEHLIAAFPGLVDLCLRGSDLSLHFALEQRPGRRLHAGRLPVAPAA
jgi:hypothetical protein